jgi:CheY-like chemotaxis protein
VESQPGEGTSFRFTALLAPAQEPAQAANAPVQDANNLKVLVAEDNVVNQRIVLKMLEKLGVLADLVTDGSRAIAAAARVHYHLVLMDVQMPDMDGLTATQEIRTGLPSDLQPVIVGLTAHATTEYRDICLRAGMNGCLTKPLEPEKLRILVAKVSAQARNGTVCNIATTIDEVSSVR